MYPSLTYESFVQSKDNPYYMHQKLSWDSHSTKTNTPSASEYGEDERDIPGDCFLAISPSQVKQQIYGQEGFEDFEIDVKPKKKDFKSPEEKMRFVEEYSRKLKTEMCKNWETTGQCKFGDKCSFAHGIHELKNKNHLHSNYKTKPCKKFFLRGFCSYGIRCQYLHSDLLYRPEFREFAQKVYASKQLRLPPIIGTDQSMEEFWILRFRKLKQNFKLKKWFINDIICVTGNSQRRLPIFAEITSSQLNYN